MKLKTLSIATCNLYNLNEPGLPMYLNKAGWSEAAYQAKIAWAARQLATLQSDVFAFQELWHRDSLARILQQAGLAADYDLLAPANAQGHSIVCAAIVRKGLLAGEAEWIRDFPEAFVLKSGGDDPQTPTINVRIKGFSRPVLHFSILPRSDRPAVHIYVCHFKSKAPAVLDKEPWFKKDREIYADHRTCLGTALSTVRRTAEAAALRFLLTEQMKANDTPVVVLGDLNDGQYSNTESILTEQPRYLMGDSIGGRDVALYTAQALQQFRDTRDVYYTHVYQGMRESLDHILLSQEFYDHSKKRIWLFEGLTINNDHLNFEDHKTDGSTDHGIVRTVFSYKPAA